MTVASRTQHLQVVRGVISLHPVLVMYLNFGEALKILLTAPLTLPSWIFFPESNPPVSRHLVTTFTDKLVVTVGDIFFSADGTFLLDWSLLF